MAGRLKVLLVGGPMYEPLYRRIGEFEKREGVEVERVIAPTHPDLNERVEREFGSGEASYDLISTHTKYAPSQRRWLLPLEETEEDFEAFSGRTLELARIDGALYGVPRNLGVSSFTTGRTSYKERLRLGKSCASLPSGYAQTVSTGSCFPARRAGSSDTSSNCTRWPEERCSRVQEDPRPRD